ncbi:MAG: hypothetical protein IJ861_09490 [Clostridia bacterium]|nr:hypothetical protein [Clostridia bacterium]
MMKYCTRCKKIYFDSNEKNCPLCGKKTISEPNHLSPVLMITANGFELERIRSALEDADIPYSYQQSKHDTGLQILNSAPFENCDVYVSFGDYERAADVLTGIGAFKEEPPQLSEDTKEILKKAQRESDQQRLSPKKAKIIRIVSGIGFLLILAAAAFLTDFIIALIKQLFGA